MTTRTITLLLTLACFSASAQTNTVSDTNKPAARVSAPDPIAEANKLITYRTSQISQLRAEAATLNKQIVADNQRDKLKEDSGQASASDRRASAARRTAQSQKAKDIQKKIAALELEVMDIRKRYNLPETSSGTRRKR